MQQLYSRTPLSSAEKRELNDEIALLGINASEQLADEVEFWDEHKNAVEWFMQVQDLMRYSYGAGIAICEGLDVLAVQADAQMSGREIEKEDYLKLRLIGQSVAKVLNQH